MQHVEQLTHIGIINEGTEATVAPSPPSEPQKPLDKRLIAFLAFTGLGVACVAGAIEVQHQAAKKYPGLEDTASTLILSAADMKLTGDALEGYEHSYPTVLVSPEMYKHNPNVTQAFREYFKSLSELGRTISKDELLKELPARTLVRLSQLSQPVKDIFIVDINDAMSSKNPQKAQNVSEAMAKFAKALVEQGEDRSRVALLFDGAVICAFGGQILILSGLAQKYLKSLAHDEA